MNIIHDENKIKELMVTRFGYESTEVYKMTYSVNEVKELMRFYAEHIREKTIDECIACVPEKRKVICEKGCPFCERGLQSKCNIYESYREFNDSIDQAITNLNKLKSNEKTN